MFDVGKVGNDFRTTLLCMFSFFATVTVGMVCSVYILLGVSGSIDARSIYEIYKPQDLSVNDQVIFVTKFGAGPLGYEYRVCDGKVQHKCSTCNDNDSSSSSSSSSSTSNRGIRQHLPSNSTWLPSQRSMTTQASEGDIVSDPDTCPCGSEKYWEDCALADPSVVLGDCTKAVEGLKSYAKFLGAVGIVTIILAPGVLLLRFASIFITGFCFKQMGCGKEAESVFWTGWATILALVCVPLNLAGFIVALGVNGKTGCDAGTDLLDNFGFALSGSIKRIHAVTGVQMAFLIVASIVFFAVICAYRAPDYSSSYSFNVTPAPVTRSRFEDSFRPRSIPQRASDSEMQVQQQRHMENPFEPVPTGVRPIGGASLQRQATDVTEIEFEVEDELSEPEYSEMHAQPTQPPPSYNAATNPHPVSSDPYLTSTQAPQSSLPPPPSYSEAARDTKVLGLELSPLPAPFGFESKRYGTTPDWMLSRNTKAYVLRVENRTQGNNRVTARQYWCPVLWPMRWDMKLRRSKFQMPTAFSGRGGNTTSNSALPPHPDWYACFEVKPGLNCSNAWFIDDQPSYKASSGSRFTLDPRKGEKYFLIKKGTPMYSSFGGHTKAAA